MNESRLGVEEKSRGRCSMRSGRAPFPDRMRVVVGTVVVVVLVILLWYTVEVILLVFAGILLAILLRGLSDQLSQYTPLNATCALAVVMLMLLAILGIGIWLLAPDLAAQLSQLVETLPRSIQYLEQRIRQYGIGQWLLTHAMPVSELLPEGSALGRIKRVFSTTLGALASLIVILVIGLYMAVAPRVYTEGVTRLVPVARRGRAHEVLQALGHTLRWWLLGRWISMMVVGMLTAVGLWLLGVPLALTFGLLAALLTFIPYLGPFISAIPPTLMILMQSPIQALYVILLYLSVQSVESYLLTPLVQQRTVSLPPALTITAQLFLGLLLGTFGVILATPLMAVTLVLVKMLYIEDVLGEGK
jgi:predicted PurR-regulated permease PerM